MSSRFRANAVAAAPLLGCVAVIVAIMSVVGVVSAVIDWRQSASEPPVGSVGDPQRGRLLTSQYGCTSCHEIAGGRTPAGTVGPSLARFARRRYVAGRFQNEPITLAEWIRSPQAMKPGTAMPDMSVSERDARDIAAFLEKLE